MTSKPDSGCDLSIKSNGFVVAMRAKFINANRPTCFEWVIVSRWGADGERLSIGWTSRPALAGATPINLTPSKTSIALCRPRTAADTPPTFLLAPMLPDEITVAGDFVPAEGYVRLYGSGPTLRVRLKGSCLSCPNQTTWRVEAERAAWLGEFIEPPVKAGA